MGHPTDLFTPAPAASCICAICHDVLEDASSLKECGHAFCDACIRESLGSGNAKCPNCRAAATGTNSAYVVRDLVGAMRVRCPERGGGDGDRASGNKRKRGENDGDGVSAVDGCDWKGPLKDLKNHEDVCDFKVITCMIDGCDHACKRKDMAGHLSGAGMVVHVNLMNRGYERKMKAMEKSIRADCDKKLKLMENGMLHARYVNDCRGWIERRPDALFDFSIYSLRNKSNHQFLGLLCYIPGPTGSAWEGARIPMTLYYSPQPVQLGRPKCKFLPGFFHPNVHPSGRVSVSTLMVEHHWSPETTLPEILFTVQQLLGHPNFTSPAQIQAYNVRVNEGLERYHDRVREEADQYSGYAGHHDLVRGEMLSEGESVDEIDIVKRSEMMAGRSEPRERPTPPRILKDADGNVQKENLSTLPEHANCECSCCAWGQVFWDGKKRMRFLFGIPG